MHQTLDDVRAALAPFPIADGPLHLDDYQKIARLTDRTGGHSSASASILLLGLFGEVGSLLSEMKKKQKDQNTFKSYADSAMEEMGDVLWYFATIASLAGLPLSDIAGGASHEAHGPVTFLDLQRQTRLFEEPLVGTRAEQRLLGLAALTGRAIEHWTPEGLEQGDEAVQRSLSEIFVALVNAADDAGLSLETAAVRNVAKILDRYPVRELWGDRFDLAFGDDERLPDIMEIRFTEKTNAKGGCYVIQQWNGVNIGDRLTDNSASEDFYRYHDVFHLSYAAFLGWSPVLRALLRLKRKSDPRVDEHEDGARAVITEEGISNWIFSHGLRREAFATATSLDFALLQTVRAMVKGYEVESRSLWMWERAILEGFKVFRQLRDNRGGVVVANLSAHTLTYRGEP